MAVVKNLMVRAGADFSSIVTQSKKASQAMSNMGKSISASTGTIKKALGAIGIAVSFAAIVSASKDAVNAYNAQAEAEAKLAAVMRNTVGASAEEVQAIKDLCSAQQQLGVIGDEVQLAGAQQLAMYTKQTSSIQTLIPAMNDLAAKQYGFSVTQENAASIAAIMGKALQGNTTSLAKLGITLTDAQKKVLQYGTEADRVAVLSQAIEANVGGMNQALANTPTGRMQQLSNVMGDIKEKFGQAISTIGTVFLPLLYKLANILSAVATFANRVAQSIANVFGKKLNTTAAASVGSIADAYEDTADAANSAGSAAKKAAKSILGFDELNKLTDNSSTSSGSSSSGSISSGSSGGYSWTESLDEDVPESYGKLEAALTKVKEVAEKVAEKFEKVKKLVTGEITFGEFIKSLNGLETAFVSVATAIVLVVAAIAVVKAALAVVNIISTAITLLTSPFGIAVIVIAALVAAGIWLYQNWEEIKAKCIEIWEEVTTEFGILKDGIIEVWESIKNSTTECWENIKTTTVTLWNMVVGKVSSAWNNILAKVNTTKQTITDKIEEFKNNLAEKWESIKQTVITVWEAIKEAIVLPIADARVAVQGVVDGIVNGLSSAWVTLRENTAGVFVGIYNTICGIIDAAWGYVSGIIENIRSAFATVSDGVQSAFEFGDGGMWSGGYASGGFPNAGQLFIAREAGPEMVGTIGGSTAVANNDQIVAAVSRGVFEAVSAAMSNGSNDVRVYLDGSEMTNIITRNQRRNAYTMGY